MNNHLKYFAFAIALVLSASLHANADNVNRHHEPPPQQHRPKTAPEVDPSLAVGGFTLLGGTLTVLRARRRR